ncbi:uncharacterized protein LOC142503567 [Ascaphus truei]|uniref:uncharacterized protein LOC142503567 n=1 Tax=Ascaphus truei TaxID=8439 RepID=UPI003F59E7FF
MARNEEKQQGRLNRLWLHKEKEAGHIKEGFRDRPRLSALHTAAGVKKWIPSIKKEIEYYLEQSQLAHYSERKIQEFQEKIETLSREYQSHLWKLRKLDPTCKEHPWKLRGYTRKRAADDKVPCWMESGGHSGAKILCTPILNHNVQNDRSDSEEEETSYKAEGNTAVIPICSTVDPEVQDKPLLFNSAKSHPKHIWLRSSYHSGGDDTHRINNIHPSNDQDQQGNTSVEKKQEIQPEGPTGSSMKGILALDCYSSSEEDS